MLGDLLVSVRMIEEHFCHRGSICLHKSIAKWYLPIWRTTKIIKETTGVIRLRQNEENCEANLCKDQMELACRRDRRGEWKIAEDPWKRVYPTSEVSLRNSSRDTLNLPRRTEDDDTCPMSVFYSHGREKCTRLRSECRCASVHHVDGALAKTVIADVSDENCRMNHRER